MIVFSISLLMPLETAAKNLMFGIEVGNFGPGNSDLTGVYGSGGLCYGINGTFFFTKSLSIFAGFNLFNADGTIPVIEADTSLKLNTLRSGVFYNINMKKFTPKIGAGAVYAMAKEENSFGSFSDSGIGWFVGAGLDFRLSGAFLVGLELLYHDAKIEGDFGEEFVGGMSMLLNLKIEI